MSRFARPALAVLLALAVGCGSRADLDVRVAQGDTTTTSEPPVRAIEPTTTTVPPQPSTTAVATTTTLMAPPVPNARWGDEIVVRGPLLGSAHTVFVGDVQALRFEARAENELSISVPSGPEPGWQAVSVDLGAGPFEVESIWIINNLLPGDSEISPGIVVVRLTVGADPITVASRNDALSIRPVFSHRGDPRLDRYHVFEVEPGLEEEAILRLAADPEVEWAEPSYLAGLDTAG